MREYEKRASLKAAFWLKLTDREKRYLYLASKRVDDIGLLAAYGELVHLTRGLAQPLSTRFEYASLARKTH